ncbi:hypothetical protein SAMN04489713_1349 [Actinomadura madurae]|uniref:Uncharacterized protein n=1 Tax=Actinomadura madurae TaxID=1993 RepID=A0A1I5YKC9_9ACTN|nr:hypothetical protein SAMN04489713_1349 [Actinomadura madurae]
MTLAYTFSALAGLLAAVCLLQVITGREVVRLSRTRHPPGRVRRMYSGPTLIGVGGVLLGAGIVMWVGMGLLWGGLILAVATTARRS